ncbi:hypothetical protein [Rhodococcus sp. YH3-3]|uniref:hypothetical protein n=1 Tax=Rhodococcus sp. YH3-3 TaxID=1803579 RepID=UPI0007DB2449|nr:hypothetical protein [Rhodococcus sp. YH3-3]
MSRLSSSTFITQHHQLKELWNSHQDSYRWMSPADQQLIHDFYRPSENLSDDELKQHRRHITVTNKSLANRAGKAYARFIRGETYDAPSTTTSSGRIVTIRPVLRPQPDAQLLAKALIQLAMEEAKAEINQRSTDDKAA